MTKPIAIFQAPIATRSGYGDMCRDIARHLIELDMFDLRILSTPWGATPMNALDGTDPMDQEIIKRLQNPPLQLAATPAIFFHGTIPNEFIKSGARVNVGVTAGIETNMCSQQWIEGCNRMHTVWAISNHAVQSIRDTVVTQQLPNGQQNEIKPEIPFEVLHNCVHTDIFKKTDATDIVPSINEMMQKVNEKFCFLFVGHWLRGGLGEDRKNVGILIKTFCETFKMTPGAKKPALILKTSGADFSVLDREEILRKIQEVKNLIGPSSPSVYLIHGDLSLTELNSLYNHPKIKVHISFTKGEGFGRPLLEASMSEKPIMVSGWSGHLDFLNPVDALLLGGEIKQVEPGSVWDGVIIRESSWFNVDPAFASKAMLTMFKDYDRFLPGAKKLAKENREKFNSNVIKARLKELIEKYVPAEFLSPPQMVPLSIPKLPGNLTLPKLKKIGATTE